MEKRARKSRDGDGWGFFLLGGGLSVLFILLGESKWGIAVLVFIGSALLCFAVTKLGWLDARSHRMRIARSLILFGAIWLGMATLGFIRWPKPVGASRIDVFNIVPVNKSELHSFAFVNVFFKNVGNAPVICYVDKEALAISPVQLHRDVLDQYFRDLNTLPFFCNERNQIPVNDPGRWVTVPDSPNAVSDELANSLPSIVSEKKALYVLGIFKYQDATMPSNRMRVTEFCGYFFGATEVWHNCGNNRTFDVELPE